MIDALPPPPKSPREVAEYLGVSLAVVYRLVRARKLAAIKVGGQYRVTIATIHKFLEDEIQL